VSNKGGFVDLPAGTIIRNAEILDGRLIVFGLDAIYELVPTGNYREPFQIALVDDTHGNRSTEVVEVNNMLMFANNFGFYFYDGRNVNKMSIALDDDYDTYEYRFGTIYKDSADEFIYVLMSTTLNNIYGNRLLAYNFRNNTFSLILDLYTALGTIYNRPSGSLIVQPKVLLGNHRGYTFLFNSNAYKNNASQSIISMTRFDANNVDLKVYNHQLTTSNRIRVENSLLVNFNGSYKIQSVVDGDTVRITDNGTLTVGNYLGDGTLALIDLILITTKQFNPYMSQGYGTSINKISFNVNRTAINGNVIVAGLPNNSTVQADVPNFYLGDNTLDTVAYALVEKESTQSRLWHDVFLQASAESVALALGFSDENMLDDDIPYQELTINAIMIDVEPSLSF